MIARRSPRPGIAMLRDASRNFMPSPTVPSSALSLVGFRSTARSGHAGDTDEPQAMNCISALRLR